MEQSQPEVFIPSMLLITAVAQPTPARTETAPAGQLSAHAPHSIQASLSATLALLCDISKTARGQTVAHMAHPVHASPSSCRVTTSLM
jgi:hypothetical protein